jgi:hypothetical protein
MADYSQVQPYTGRPVIVIPRVWYREADKPAVELIFAKDFLVSYKNNTSVGTADLILHGKGKYRGKKRLTFNIVEA